MIYNKYIADSTDVPDITDEREAVAGVQITYCGWCLQGVESRAERAWKIARYAAVVGGGATVTERMFPDGSLYYDKVWDDRETYNYIFHR